MENQDLFRSLSACASKVKFHNNIIREAVSWIKENLPIDSLYDRVVN